VAAVYASLSPGADWEINVHIGDQLLDIYANKQEHRWDEKMQATADRIWKTARTKPLVDDIRGKTLGELKTATEKAVWIRTYDEAHNSQNFQTVRPDGTLGELKKNNDGSPAKAAWQTVPNIANAIKAIEADGDLQKISEALPKGAHKVRSFFNNILDPNSGNEDVTIDTHAVGAALLRPLGGSHPGPLQNFGLTPDKADQPEGWESSSGSVVTGSHGLYPLYADAIRETAHELGIQPRELQSITWETKRSLFEDLTKAQKLAIDQVWRDYHINPDTTLADVQKKIVEIGGGIKKGWQNGFARRIDPMDAGEGHPGDARELHRRRLGEFTRVVGRTRIPVAPASPGLEPVRDRQGDEGIEAADEEISFQQIWMTVSFAEFFDGEDERQAIEYMGEYWDQMTPDEQFRAAILAQVVCDYDESKHPRDEQGRWSGGGGDGGGIASGGGPPVVAFHGTIETVVDSIMKEGMHVTAKSHHFDGSVYAGDRGESVFVTTNQHTAISYASNYAQSESWHQYKAVAPVVFKLAIPQNEWAKFKEDRLEPDSRYTREIPPAWITGAFKIGARDSLVKIKSGAGVVKADAVEVYMVIFVGEPK
jgi:hypothetical protein